MEKMNIKKSLVLIAHAIVLWGLCGAVMAIGMANWKLETALIVHAIAAPIFAVAVSSIYYRKFSYTTPLQTATVFLAFVIFMDTFLVAMTINKSFAMFKSFIGTWLPFILIFISVWITGLVWRKKSAPK